MKYGRHLAYFRAAFFDIGNTCFNQVHGQIPPANIDAVHRLQEKGFQIVPISKLIYKDNYHMEPDGSQVKDGE